MKIESVKHKSRELSCNNDNISFSATIQDGELVLLSITESGSSCSGLVTTDMKYLLEISRVIKELEKQIRESKKD